MPINPTIHVSLPLHSNLPYVHHGLALPSSQSTLLHASLSNLQPIKHTRMPELALKIFIFIRLNQEQNVLLIICVFN